MSITTASATDLIRTDIWSAQLKDILRDELLATRFARQTPMFQDGDTLHIPSIGDLTAQDYTEDTPISFTPLSTGDWTLQITEYVQSGVYVTDKFRQDSFYAGETIAQIPFKQARAIMQRYETHTFARPEAVFNTGANTTFPINGAPHRFAASGTSPSGVTGVLTLDDFSYARNALNKANVPLTNLIAVVDQDTASRLEIFFANAGITANPQWDRVFREGNLTGSRFLMSVMGFDVYVSNYLVNNISDAALPNYTGSATEDFSVMNGVGCLFFSADSEVTPWLTAWRESPSIEQERRASMRRTEISTTARWGTGLYRPEAVVEIVSKPVIQ